MNPPSENFVDSRVTYTVELNGKFYIVENVPARVCAETGESFFAPSTVEAIHELILKKHAPKRLIETEVFDFAA